MAGLVALLAFLSEPIPQTLTVVASRPSSARRTHGPSGTPLLVLELFEASRNALCGESYAFKKLLLFTYHGRRLLRPFGDRSHKKNEEDYQK
jgi:hypothetical protein